MLPVAAVVPPRSCHWWRSLIAPWLAKRFRTRGPLQTRGVVESKRTLPMRPNVNTLRSELLLPMTNRGTSKEAGTQRQGLPSGLGPGRIGIPGSNIETDVGIGLPSM